MESELTSRERAYQDEAIGERTSRVRAFRAKALDVQDLREEFLNSLTHGVGLAFSVAGLAWLVALASLYGDVWHIVSCSIYGATLVMLYASSTLYHGFQRERIKEIFNTLDHACIYLLIAGTYTPFTLTLLRGVWGWTIFSLVWSLAVTGIILKILFKVNRWRFLSTAFYLAMGWLMLIAIGPLIRAVPPGGLALVVAGGLSYTVGVIFYAKDNIRFFHAIWHLFVMAGSVFHFLAVLYYVVPAGK